MASVVEGDKSITTGGDCDGMMESFDATKYILSIFVMSSATVLLEEPPFRVGEFFLLRPFFLGGEDLVGDFVVVAFVCGSPGEDIDSQVAPFAIEEVDSILEVKVFIIFNVGSKTLLDFVSSGVLAFVVDLAFFPLLGELSPRESLK